MILSSPVESHDACAESRIVATGHTEPARAEAEEEDEKLLWPIPTGCRACRSGTASVGGAAANAGRTSTVKLMGEEESVESAGFCVPAHEHSSRSGGSL